MARTMSPSTTKTITDGLIEKIAAQFRDAMRAHREEIPSDVAQFLVSQDNIGMKLYDFMRSEVNTHAGLVVHAVQVNRSRTVQEALDASGRTLHVHNETLASAPLHTPKRVTLIYFELDPTLYNEGSVPNEVVDAEYARRGLVADLQAQIDDNIANPSFTDTRCNACQWRDENGNLSHATFYNRDAQQYAYVGAYSRSWNSGWRYGGVRKR